MLNFTKTKNNTKFSYKKEQEYLIKLMETFIKILEKRKQMKTEAIFWQIKNKMEINVEMNLMKCRILGY